MTRILVISPTPSHPQDAGNRVRIFSLLSGLKAAGNKIYFTFVKMECGDEKAMADTWDCYFALSYQRTPDRWLKRQFDRWARRLGTNAVLAYGIDDWCPPEISRQIREIRDKIQPDVVIVEYVFLSRVLKCFGPQTLKVLDTHDVFGDRHKLYRQGGMPAAWFYTTVAQEKKALDRADIVLAIQDNEAAYFSRLTSRRVCTVGHLTQIPSAPPREEEAVERLLFVGSANPINVDALRWFIADIFPALRRELPCIMLEIVGESAEKIEPGDGLILTGKVTDLTSCYRSAKVVINPVRFGTGLKIKTIEALAMGKPLVTTRAGAAGLEGWEGNAFLIGDTPPEFVKAVLAVWTSPELRTGLMARATRLAVTRNDTVLMHLLETIRAAAANDK